MKQTTTHPSMQTIFIICTIFFWGIPFIKDALPPEESYELIRTCLMFCNPLFCLGMSYMYFTKTSFTWFLPIGFMLIFLPLPFLFYQLQDIMYVPVYGFASLCGWFLSFLVNHQHKLRR